METSEVFLGRTSAMRAENQFLGAEDIAGLEDVNVIIEQCLHRKNVKFEAGRTKADVFSLKFRGKTKELILTPTKRRPLVQAFGTHVKDWIGKTISLYVDYNVNKPGCPGEKTWGVRVREIVEPKP